MLGSRLQLGEEWRLGVQDERFQKILGGMIEVQMQRIGAALTPLMN